MYKFKKIIKNISLLLLSFALLCISNKQFIKANELNTSTDILSRINETVNASHTITFSIINQVNVGGTVQITFPPSSFIFGSSYNFNDMTLAQGSSNNCSTATFNNKTLASIPNNTTWGAVFNSNTITFTSGADTLLPNTCIQVILNTNGTNHTITNPTISSNTTYNVNIVTSSQDTGELAVVILGDATGANNDQIQINAQVIPTISLIVDASLAGCTSAPSANQNINLGILLPGNVVVSGTNHEYICIGGGTNALNGMKILVQDSRNSISGGLVSGSNFLASTTGDLNILSKGYGIRVISSGTTQFGIFNSIAPFNSGAVGNEGSINGILGTSSQIINSTAPVNSVNTNRIQIEVGAKVDTTQATGTYSDIITFTAFTL